MRFIIWLASGYAHVFILLSVVIVTLRTLIRTRVPTLNSL